MLMHSGCEIIVGGMRVSKNNTAEPRTEPRTDASGMDKGQTPYLPPHFKVLPRCLLCSRRMRFVGSAFTVVVVCFRSAEGATAPVSALSAPY